MERSHMFLVLDHCIMCAAVLGRLHSKELERVVHFVVRLNVLVQLPHRVPGASRCAASRATHRGRGFGRAWGLIHQHLLRGRRGFLAGRQRLACGLWRAGAKHCAGLTVLDLLDRSVTELSGNDNQHIARCEAQEHKEYLGVLILEAVLDLASWRAPPFFLVLPCLPGLVPFLEDAPAVELLRLPKREGLGVQVDEEEEEEEAAAEDEEEAEEVEGRAGEFVCSKSRS